VIVLSLGAAMGITTSLFSVVNALWFTPWSVQGSEELRVVDPGISSEEWQSWTEQTRSFSGLAAERGQAVRLGGQLTFCSLVSSNFFEVLRVPLVMGRGFAPDDAADTGANRAVISHHLWQTRLGGDPNIVGRSITVDQTDPSLPATSLTIVGVSAAGFDGTATFRTQLWLPLAAAREFQTSARRDEASSPSLLNVKAFGRLAPGGSNEQAEAELSVLSQRFRSQRGLPRSAIVLRSTDRFSQSPPSAQTRGMWGSLLVGIVFIALIACANVSNLLLARGHARRGEIALRLALGGTRGRVVRQLLTESLILSIAAAGLGVMIAGWLPETVFRSFLQDTSLGELLQLTFPLDLRVFLWSLAISAIACFAFGLAPALRCTEVALGEVMKEGQQNSKRVLMPSILSYQAIVSVMAMAIAGLMLRSGPVNEARAITRSVADLTVVRLDLPRGVDSPQRQTLVSTISERLGAIAGVENVSGIAEQIQAGVSQTLHVTPTYFSVAGIPWVSGRTFASTDPSDRVMVVNEAFAHHFWPDRSAIGQALTSDAQGVWDRKLVGREVVGVVGNAQLSRPTAYLPVEPSDVQAFLVRATQGLVTRETARLIATLRPTVTMKVLSGSAWIAQITGPTLLAVWITAAFGGVALLLGAIGIFSLLEYSVQQRTREIGIRRALGAEPWDIIRSIIAAPALPLARGLLIGSAGAVVAGAFMRRADLPAGINPLDLLTYAVVAAVLIVAAVLAAYGPARRALRIEPSKALRFE
jgi:predicted permease